MPDIRKIITANATNNQGGVTGVARKIIFEFEHKPNQVANTGVLAAKYEDKWDDYTLYNATGNAAP